MKTTRLSSIDEINLELVDIWKQHREWIDKNRPWIKQTDSPSVQIPFRCPLQYPLPRPGGVAFVGFNPSFSHVGWRKVLKRSHAQEQHDDESIDRLFARDIVPESFAKIIKLEEDAQASIDFFKFHDDVKEHLGVDWTHLDLFAWRHTTQGDVRSLLVDGGRLKSDFAVAQLEVFDALLELVKPRAVVITNALASEIYLERRGIKDTFHRVEGYYVDEIAGAKNVPVLPAGMLTGQRAMDRYSRQRLLWKLGQIIHAEKGWIPLATPNKKDPDALDANKRKASSPRRRKP